MEKIIEFLKERAAIVIVVLILGVLLVIISVSDNIALWDLSISAADSQQKDILLIIGGVLIIFSLLLLLKPETSDNKKVIDRRDKITDENVRLIGESEQSVNSFSGDLSWAESCSTALKDAVEREVKVNILCKEPKNSNAIPFALIKKYIRAKGISIKYYPLDFDPQLRGLMIDPDKDCEALFVEKKNKKSGYSYDRDGRKTTDEEFEFWGQVYSSKNDQSIIRPFAKMFEILWQTGEIATLLSEGSWAEIETELRKLPQYYNAEISQRLIKVSHMLPLHNHLESDRYNKVKSFYNKFNRYNLPLYVPVIEYTTTYSKLICPPIVEKHEGKYIIIDGLARVHVARSKQVDEIYVCVIDKVSTPLVGKPWRWDDVKILERDVPKREKFQDYNPEHWRDIKEIDYALKKS